MRTLPIRQGLLFVTLFLLGIVASSRPAQAQDQEVIDEIVAIVGNDIVLRSDVDGAALAFIQQEQAQYSDDLWLNMLTQLINQKVLTIHAKRDTNITVRDDQVTQQLDQRIAQLTRQAGSEERVEEIYGKSIIQLKADLREEFKNQILAEQIRAFKVRDIRITPSEVQTWFSQFPTDSLPTLPEVVRLSHIVRHPDPTPEAQQEALEIISTIRDSVVVGGASFEDLAATYSDDGGSASNGGRYQTDLSTFVAEFNAVAARIPIGEISQPFRTQFGYHILRVNERRGDFADLNHILIEIDESKVDPTAARAMLATLRDSIVTHQVPFEVLAKRHSEEDLTRDIGGRVVDPNSGERDLFLDALGPTWKRTIDTLDIGQISHPAEVQLLDGSRSYHIVKVTRRVPPHRVDIHTDYERIEQLALREKQQEVLQDWVNQLKKTVYLELRGKAKDLADNASPPSQNLSQRPN